MTTLRYFCRLALPTLVLWIAIHAHAQGNLCTQTWHATACGEETWNATEWHEQIVVSAGPNQAGGNLVMLPDTEPTIDMSLTTLTSAGDLALAGVLDVNKFLVQNPGIDISPVFSACIVPNNPACAPALQNLANSVSQDQLKAAAVWWHGCKNASDQQTKVLTGLPRTPIGYLIAAQAQGGSGATVKADLTHHANPPQIRKEVICGPSQTGNMPAQGNYTNQVVGHASLALAPQHGGTLSATRTFWVYSLQAKGTFSVDNVGNIGFTGNVSRENCPHIPAPRPVILRPQPKDQ
jgi:hypothetical protein